MSYGRSPYMNLREVAEYCRLIDHKTGELRVEAARKWIALKRIPKKHVGKQIIVHRDEVEAAIEGTPLNLQTRSGRR